MSLTALYSEKKTAFAPPKNQETYGEFVFSMEKNGTNDLVERDIVDPTFRPPLASNSYSETIFQKGSNLNQQ
jgi:hypothetical protein